MDFKEIDFKGIGIGIGIRIGIGIGIEIEIEIESREINSKENPYKNNSSFEEPQNGQKQRLGERTNEKA